MERRGGRPPEEGNPAMAKIRAEQRKRLGDKAFTELLKADLKKAFDDPDKAAEITENIAEGLAGMFTFTRKEKRK
jgi:flagellar hook-basal body complex protein FliE